MGFLAHLWFEIMEFSQFLIIFGFLWCWKMAAKKKSEIWSFLKALDYYISMAKC